MAADINLKGEGNINRRKRLKNNTRYWIWIYYYEAGRSGNNTN